MPSEPLAYLSAVDPVLARLIQQFGPIKIRRKRIQPYQSLIHAIAHQQLTGKAAATILSRFQALFGNGQFPAPAQVLALELDRLRSIGFSRAKATFVHAVAERAVNGLLPTLLACKKLTDAEILEQLTQIKGVGRWTAEMFLMFTLGRPDVLPVHDFGVRKGFQIAYRKRKLPDPDQLEKHGAKWSPHRTTASLYLYRAADFLTEEDW